MEWTENSLQILHWYLFYFNFLNIGKWWIFIVWIFKIDLLFLKVIRKKCSVSWLVTNWIDDEHSITPGSYHNGERRLNGWGLWVTLSINFNCLYFLYICVSFRVILIMHPSTMNILVLKCRLTLSHLSVSVKCVNLLFKVLVEKYVPFWVSRWWTRG
jgi:hypothetical protein